MRRGVERFLRRRRKAHQRLKKETSKTKDQRQETTYAESDRHAYDTETDKFDRHFFVLAQEQDADLCDHTNALQFAGHGPMGRRIGIHYLL